MERSGWRRERLPEHASFLTLAPDWLCEVREAGRQRVEALRPELRQLTDDEQRPPVAKCSTALVKAQ